VKFAEKLFMHKRKEPVTVPINAGKLKAGKKIIIEPL
jgi:hypothetical protein